MLLSTLNILADILLAHLHECNGDDGIIGDKSLLIKGFLWDTFDPITLCTNCTYPEITFNW